MKILHICSVDYGGAAKSCIRLHLGLLELGVDSKVLFLNKTSKSIPGSYKYTNPSPNKISRIKESLKKIFQECKLISPDDSNDKWKYLKGRPKGFEIFSFPDTPYEITSNPLLLDADIVNLHWTAGFLDYRSFFAKCHKKIVWTLHDMNPFTGGCHYSSGCKGFTFSCNNCDQLLNTIDPGFAGKNLNLKMKALECKRDSDLTIVSPSLWLMQESKASKLFSRFNHLCIPYGLNSKNFKARDRNSSRELLGIPLNKNVILFVADSLSNRRKGFTSLLKAVELLSRPKDTVLCVVGADAKAVSDHFCGEIVIAGTISDELLMSVAYSAADLFVIPSFEDNLPNTVLESLMCGTPVVGFPVGGIVDMVKSGFNGLLSKDCSAESLADSINDLLARLNDFDRISIAQEANKKYEHSVQANSYIRLYSEILNIEVASNIHPD